VLKKSSKKLRSEFKSARSRQINPCLIQGILLWSGGQDNILTKRTVLRTISQRSETMTTLTASEARAGLYRLIDQAAESHKPVIISGKRANAVLVSEEDWSAIQETLYLLATPGMRESIKESMAEPIAKSKRTLKW
jgi:prevent-host-death family protein